MVRNRKISYLLKLCVEYYGLSKTYFNCFRDSNIPEIKEVLKMYDYLMFKIGFSYEEIALLTEKTYKQVSYNVRQIEYRTYDEKQLKTDIENILQKYKKML